MKWGVLAIINNGKYASTQKREVRLNLMGTVRVKNYSLTIKIGAVDAFQI